MVTGGLLFGLAVVMKQSAAPFVVAGALYTLLSRAADGTGLYLTIDRWAGQAAYDAFRTWLRWFAVQWDQVRTADSIPAAERELEALFGEDVVKEALRKHATDTSTLRKAGRLNVTRAGGLTSAASISSVRPNTFFGK